MTDRPSPLLERLRDVARRSPASIALEDAAVRRSFGELWERAERVAGALRALDLGGARIGLYASPGAAWAEAFAGALLAGGTAVALSPIYPVPELRALAAASGVRGVLVSKDLEPAAREAFRNVRVLGADDLAAASRPPETAAAAPRPNDVALLLFTSGTTGKPKGAALTHENVFALAEILGKAWGFSPNDVLLHTLPLHHLHGIGVSLLVALVAGATTRFVRFEPERVWEELRHATVLMGVPTQHKKLFDAFDAADSVTRTRWASHGAALRLVTSGSAALPVAVGERWRSLSGRYPVERYGMTEIGIVLSNPLDGERRPGTVGKPLPNVTIRVVVDGGVDAAPGEAGELWVRASTVFAGYDGNARATEDALSDGWFKTGDTVTVSDDGYVTILGRTSVDILKSGGYKLSALEIEAVLREHEDVADVSVVGVPHEIWGDLVVAAVVAKPGRAPDEAAVRSWAKERMAPYKVPKRVVAVGELPRNALGKVQKNVLAGLLRDRKLL